MKITEKEMLEEICAIIYYQAALKVQDNWLKMMIDMGMWEPEDEE